MSMDNSISSDGQGVLVGVTPAQPTYVNTATPRPDQAVSQPVQVVEQPQHQPTNVRFTDEDIERARQQEKEKLYPRLEEMSEQLKALKAERDAEQAERQRLAEEAEVARRTQEEQEMDLRSLLERREAEMRAEIESLNNRYETDRAVFERERSLLEAQQYRQARLDQEPDIIPELRDLIRGDTPEEVDRSIEEMKLRSESIIGNMRAAMEPQPFRGTAMPSVPPVGPMEQLPSYEQLTPDDIRGMDMTTYKRYREQLLAASSPNRQRGR
jgi:hypothetical protein